MLLIANFLSHHILVYSCTILCSFNVIAMKWKICHDCLESFNLLVIVNQSVKHISICEGVFNWICQFCVAAYSCIPFIHPVVQFETHERRYVYSSLYFEKSLLVGQIPNLFTCICNILYIITIIQNHYV